MRLICQFYPPPLRWLTLVLALLIASMLSILIFKINSYTTLACDLSNIDSSCNLAITATHVESTQSYIGDPPWYDSYVTPVVDANFVENYNFNWVDNDGDGNDDAVQSGDLVRNPKAYNMYQAAKNGTDINHGNQAASNVNHFKITAQADAELTYRCVSHVARKSSSSHVPSRRFPDATSIVLQTADKFTSNASDPANVVYRKTVFHKRSTGYQRCSSNYSHAPRNLQLDMSAAGVYYLTLVASHGGDYYYYHHYTLDCSKCTIESSNEITQYDGMVNRSQMLGHYINASDAENTTRYNYSCTFDIKKSGLTLVGFGDVDYYSFDIRIQQGKKQPDNSIRWQPFEDTTWDTTRDSLYPLYSINSWTAQKSPMDVNDPHIKQIFSDIDGFKNKVPAHMPQQIYDQFVEHKTDKHRYVYDRDGLNGWSTLLIDVDMKKGEYLRVWMNHSNRNYTSCGFFSDHVIDRISLIDLRVTDQCNIYIHLLSYQYPEKGDLSIEWPDLHVETYLKSDPNPITSITPSINGLDSGTHNLRYKFRNYVGPIQPKNIHWIDKEAKKPDRYQNNTTVTSSQVQTNERFLVNAKDLFDRAPSTATTNVQKMDWVLSNIVIKVKGYYAGSPSVLKDKSIDWWGSPEEEDKHKDDLTDSKVFDTLKRDNFKNCIKDSEFEVRLTEGCSVYISKIRFNSSSAPLLSIPNDADLLVKIYWGTDGFTPSPATLIAQNGISTTEAEPSASPTQHDQGQPSQSDINTFWNERNSSTSDKYLFNLKHIPATWWNFIDRGLNSNNPRREFKFVLSGHMDGSNQVDWETQSNNTSLSPAERAAYKALVDDPLHTIEIDTDLSDGHLSFYDLQKDDCLPRLEAEIRVEANVTGGSCYVYLHIRKFFRNAGTTPDVNIRTKQSGNPITSLGSNTITTRITQSSNSIQTKLFDINGLSQSQFNALASLTYDSLGWYDSGGVIQNYPGVSGVVTIPKTTISNSTTWYADKLAYIQTRWDAEKRNNSSAQVCDTTSSQPGNECANYNPATYMPNAVEDGKGGYFELTSGQQLNYSADTGSQPYSYGTKGSPQTYTETHTHTYRVPPYTTGPPHYFPVYNWATNTHGPNSITYHLPVGQTATVNYTIHQVKVETDDVEIKRMLDAVDWKGHRIDTEHFLIDKDTEIPVTIRMSYTEPDLIKQTTGDNAPAVHNESSAFLSEANASFDRQKKYTLTANYRLRLWSEAGTNATLLNGNFPQSSSDLNTFSDTTTTLPTTSGSLVYEWYVDNWTLDVDQWIDVSWRTWQSSPSLGQHPSVSEGYVAQSDKITSPTRTFSGQYAFPTCTLNIEMPVCDVKRRPLTYRTFNPNTIGASIGRRGLPVAAVGVAASRSNLELTNNNVFGIRTTSPGETTNGDPIYDRRGPGPTSPPYIMMNNLSNQYIDTEAQPTFSVNRFNPSAGTYNNTTKSYSGSNQAGYNATATWNRERQNNGDFSSAVNFNALLPASTVQISQGRRGSVAESPSTIYEPGKYLTSWNVRWATNAQVSSYWRGDEFYHGECYEHVKSTSNIKSVISEHVFVNSEAPTCRVNDYIIHERDANYLDTLTITLSNPNAVAMPLGMAQVRVNSPTPGVFEAERVGATKTMVIPKYGELTLKISQTAPAGRFLNHPDATYAGRYSSSYDYAAEVAKVTESLGEHTYESHVAAYIGHEDFTTDSTIMDSYNIQDSWFEPKHPPNDERIIGSNGNKNCSKSSVNMVRIVRRPYLKTFYGGVSTGGIFSGNVSHSCAPSSSTTLAYTLAHANDSASSPKGAASELMVASKHSLFGFYSAGSTPTSNPNPPLTGLTLGNLGAASSGNAYYGSGYSDDGLCIPNYWFRVDTLKNTPSSGLRTITADSLDAYAVSADIAEQDGNCYTTAGLLVVITPNTASQCGTSREWHQTYKGRIYYKNGDLELTNSIGNKKLKDLKLTLFVEGDLYIKDNLLNNRHTIFRDPSQIGYLLIIVKGNIYIDKSVNFIDAVLVALPDASNTKGEIWSCAEFANFLTSKTQSFTDPLTHWNACGGSTISQLEVRGALVGRVIRLGRLVTTVRRANPHPADSFTLSNASEEISLTPEYFLANPPFPILEEWSNAPDSFLELPLNL